MELCFNWKMLYGDNYNTSVDEISFIVNTSSRYIDYSIMYMIWIRTVNNTILFVLSTVDIWNPNT